MNKKIICIYGKSGSGKTFLAKKLKNDLVNSIHIDVDKLNKDLMNTNTAIDYASYLFTSKEIIYNNKLNKKEILSEIMKDSEVNNKWHLFMLELCNNFINEFISKTTFSYYIIDHLKSNKLKFDCDNIIYLECICDTETRLKRLKKREKITEEILVFRDSNYTQDKRTAMQYNNNNYNEIINLVK